MLKKTHRSLRNNFGMLLLVIPLFSVFNISAQSILDLYELLPERLTLGNQQTTEKIILNYREGHQHDIPYRFDIVDEKNGFLTVAGPAQTVWEMRSWNLGQNKKLIAVYSHQCDPY